MPIASSARFCCEALSRGSALDGLCGAALVHSVFRSVLNLQVEGTDILVALTGPEGAVLPHAIALCEPPDFTCLPVVVGTPGALTDTTLELGSSGGLSVSLVGSVTKPRAALAPIGRVGHAWHALVERLMSEQDQRSTALRIACLGTAQSSSPMGEGLAQKARGLGASTLAVVKSPESESTRATLDASVSMLVGAGEGLTPSGDDFLCGFLAAAECSMPARRAIDGLAALRRAVEASLLRTTAISRSLLLCAVRGHFPDPLLAAADALAEDCKVQALAALDRLLDFGHSSGADLATGFLYGVGLFGDTWKEAACCTSSVT